MKNEIKLETGSPGAEAAGTPINTPTGSAVAAAAVGTADPPATTLFPAPSHDTIAGLTTLRGSVTTGTAAAGATSSEGSPGAVRAAGIDTAARNVAASAVAELSSTEAPSAGEDTSERPPRPRTGADESDSAPAPGRAPRVALREADDPDDTPAEPDEPEEPDESASATAGSAATAEPTPSATARAPTRPTYRAESDDTSAPPLAR